MIAVATGKFSADELRKLAGSPIGNWDPVVLERGIADERFVEHCKIALGSSVKGADAALS